MVNNYNINLILLPYKNNQRVVVSLYAFHKQIQQVALKQYLST